jgi:uridine kinase
MYSFESALELIEMTSPRHRTVVFVCGFGGAGKSTVCRRLSQELKRSSVVFETDWYARFATVERKKRISDALASDDPVRIEAEENPKNWYDWQKLEADLKMLRETGSIYVQHGWNQSTGDKDLSFQLLLPPTPNCVTICDGIYLLHEEIRETADLKILLMTPTSVCLERTENRDKHRSSKEYLEYKAGLVEKYDRPYFAEHGQHADYLLQV